MVCWKRTLSAYVRPSLLVNMVTQERALDLLRVAGELAEREGATRVEEQHVRQAQQKIEHDRVSEVLKSLPAHSKVLLVGAYLLGNNLTAGAITGDVYEVYHELCALSDLEPLTQRRVSGLINELDVMGILNARVVSFGRYGRTKKIRLGVSPACYCRHLRRRQSCWSAIWIRP